MLRSYVTAPAPTHFPRAINAAFPPEKFLPRLYRACRNWQKPHENSHLVPPMGDNDAFALVHRIGRLSAQYRPDRPLARPRPNRAAFNSRSSLDGLFGRPLGPLGCLFGL